MLYDKQCLDFSTLYVLVGVNGWVIQDYVRLSSCYMLTMCPLLGAVIRLSWDVAS